MTDHEQAPPPRDERIINAAMGAATSAIADNIVAAMRDRGGTPEDVIKLLGRINATVIFGLTDGQREARAVSEDLIALLADYSREATRKLRADKLLRNIPTMKGHR